MQQFDLVNLCFFKKRYHIVKTAWCCVPQGLSSIFLATNFTWKMPECSSSMYSFFYMLENIRYHILPEVGQIHRKLLILFKLWDPDLNSNKFLFFYEIGPLQVKWWYQMFCSIKMEQHMEPELSGIFLRKDGCQKYSACLVIFLLLAKFVSFTFLIWLST